MERSPGHKAGAAQGGGAQQTEESVAVAIAKRTIPTGLKYPGDIRSKIFEFASIEDLPNISIALTLKTDSGIDFSTNQEMVIAKAISYGFHTSASSSNEENLSLAKDYLKKIFILGQKISGSTKIFTKESEAVLKTLLYGSQQEKEALNYTRALLDVARAGDVVSLNFLLNAGIQVDRQDDNGLTALMLASYNGHAECVRLLLAAGADVNRQANNSRTALMAASGFGHAECVRLLLAAGADVNRQNNNDATALMYATERGRTECVGLLLAAGADVNRQNTDGITALMGAAGSGYADCTHLLLEAGADVNRQAHNGLTALGFARRGGRRECIRLLLCKGAGN